VSTRPLNQPAPASSFPNTFKAWQVSGSFFLSFSLLLFLVLFSPLFLLMFLFSFLFLSFFTGGVVRACRWVPAQWQGPGQQG
jgi:hypothetical protein